MRTFAFMLMLLAGLEVHAQTIKWDSVAPATTDAAINEFASLKHYMLKPNSGARNGLVVFIPGTYRYPGNYTFVMEQIASLGYHVVGLSYKYDPPVNPLCRGTGDVTCHYRARMETIDGVDRHPGVSVSPANSIMNRLNKLMAYLVANKPGNGWEQFYANGTLQWDKIILTGHSQGASIAGIMGQEFPARGVVMFSVIDFLDNGAIPSWVNNNSYRENFYALIHPKDEQIPFTRAQIGWNRLGLTEFGAMCNIDCNSAPYRYSHILYTNYNPSTTQVDKYHNGTCLDMYINGETDYKASLSNAIRYLFLAAGKADIE